MFENVTVTDAMAEDMEKLRPRLKNIHIMELVVAMTIMPKVQKAVFTCRRRCHCSHAQPGSATGTAPHSTARVKGIGSGPHPRHHHSLEGRRSLPARPPPKLRGSTPTL